jgi:hypothetical protein
MSQVQATIAQQQFAFDTAEVGRRLRDVMPEPLGEHYVVVAGKRFPPKQVISLMTGLDRADFNTHQAFAGRWVAQRGLEVLVAADTPQAVLEWLERHNQHADAMFRVPGDETEATGVAPA